jgi:peptidoglycan hydrolase-like protein with peptidoglycan-binding domain
MRQIPTILGTTAAILLVASTALAQTSTPPGPGTTGPDQKRPLGATQPETTGREQMSGDRVNRDTETSSQRDRQARTGQTLSREEARSVQEALRGKGFDPGPIDGQLGPRTAQAVRDFQKQEGLQVTGQLDDETRTRLGV